MATRKPKKRKPAKRKAKTDKGKIPLAVLERRLDRLQKLVKARGGKAQLAMWG